MEFFSAVLTDCNVPISLQVILEEAVQKLGTVTQDKARYEQVVKGLIMQVRSVYHEHRK